MYVGVYMYVFIMYVYVFIDACMCLHRMSIRHHKGQQKIRFHGHRGVPVWCNLYVCRYMVIYMCIGCMVMYMCMGCMVIYMYVGCMHLSHLQHDASIRTLSACAVASFWDAYTRSRSRSRSWSRSHSWSRSGYIYILHIFMHACVYLQVHAYTHYMLHTSNKHMHIYIYTRTHIYACVHTHRLWSLAPLLRMLYSRICSSQARIKFLKGTQKGRSS
jgi:hypothetical protein